MQEDTAEKTPRSPNGNDLWDPDYPSPYEIDPVVAAYMPGVDRTLLRENLKLTHEQRLIQHQRAGELFLELRRAGQAMRKRSSGE